MSGGSAIIFVPDDTRKTLLSRPLFLQRVSGAPLLAWLTDALFSEGTRRFFLICADALLPDAKNCFPADCELTTTRDDDPADRLHVFLSTADETEEEIDIFTGPSAYITLPLRGDPERIAPVPANVCHASRALLMEALDDRFSFSRFLRVSAECYTGRDGFCAVSELPELMRLAPVLRRQRLLSLAQSGVEIWDYDNCYVAPGVAVGADSVLMPGTMLLGRTSIGSGCVIGPDTLVENSTVGSYSRIRASQVYDAKLGSGVLVGPYAHIRPDTVLEDHVRIGNFVEVKNSTVGENTWASHLSYLGDSDIGKNCNLGCGSVTVNFDGKGKHRTTILDEAFVGCSTDLIAPVTIGRGAVVAAGSVITADVPDNALAIARARQTVKSNWAAKRRK
jgi:bifunctional UDP-N-acetylglucosamine pyrophosphorylase/glucosamine-1-phosphate N-acetyltransferase